MKEWLSIIEVSQSLQVPDNTVRRYIQRHIEFISHKKHGKKYLIHVDSLKVLEKIRSLYTEDFYMEEQIQEYLNQQGFKKFINVTNVNKEVDNPVDHPPKEIEKIIELYVAKAIKEKEEEFFKVLEEQNKMFHSQLMQKLEERDQFLLESIRETQNSKKQIAASNRQKVWWKFWG
ncbi:DUF3967 domain-containing protein [Bacillus paramycoides]|uniref:DUF3967 domain-containing protein n=1 Tax=Bacillus paramycoides TaxID=2026194 RepID=UPI002E1F752E|nr:DUF3967 domain-containing protein [Bacillus paramycoides]